MGHKKPTDVINGGAVNFLVTSSNGVYSYREKMLLFDQNTTDTYIITKKRFQIFVSMKMLL